VATARWLSDRGHSDPGLLAAALLHDVGKGPQRPLDRVAFVAASAIGAASRAASATSRFELRRALARTVAHADVGARLLSASGASAAVVNLTRAHHAASANDPVLALLQLADAAN
jgi:hypothetical protein